MSSLVLTILLPATTAFVVGLLITPIVTHYLYRCKAWKKTGGKVAFGGHEATEFNKLKQANETKTPRMGGIVIWASVCLTLFGSYALAVLFPQTAFAQLEFLSRSQTLIPVFMLLVGALFGLLNDFYDVTQGGAGVRLGVRLSVIAVIAAGLGWWFYDKLDVTTVGVLFGAPLELGFGIVPFFVVLTLLVYASGIIDGIDGLSGGVFASVFAAYAGIALVQSQQDIATFCAVVVGAILAFLWFNIPPARFWMTETGSMALTLTLATVVFMTDSLGDGYGVSLMFVVALPLLATVASAVLQILYRKLTGRKLFRIAPIHHHFEAIGWPSEKVTMRYWIISIVCAVVGVLLAASA